MSNRPTLAEIRASFQRRRESARVLFDMELLVEHRRLTAALQKALRSNDDDSIAGESPLDASQRVDELEERIEAAEVEFVFESLGRAGWLQLVAQHPPTEAQAREGYHYDPDTFPQAALQASCVSHALDDDDATWLAAELDLGEFTKLWEACLRANAGEANRPKSVEAQLLRRSSGPSSRTAPPTASPARSSSGGSGRTRTTPKSRNGSPRTSR